MITVYDKALAANPDANRRHRIEHCGFSTPEQHRRMKEAGIYPCPQVFIYDFGDTKISVLGQERSSVELSLSRHGRKWASSQQRAAMH
ncbi:hypothetical protein [Bradyrhizobium tunisiense]|uniref:hypothetical protein n=1 Tax=Bradyrhizobium tunisiense TaxID=3278709 RepID=UPI0035D73E1D